MKEGGILKKYEYMVVYSFNLGIGRVQIITPKPIKTYIDVENLDKTVKEHNGITNAMVIDFKLLREYEE